MIAFFKPQKTKLLAIDDCLIDALDPAAADECLVEPAAKSEVVEGQNVLFFAPLLAAAFAALLWISFLPPNPDAGVGELGTPQVRVGDFEFVDEASIDAPGPPMAWK
jgi:hypothetical protein